VATGLLMLAGGAAAGVFGSLLGLGGGILIVPLLTLGFGLDLREAVGVSLVSVIVTSSAAAGVYLERHVANLRLGMTLELFTAFGALLGGLIAFLLSEQLLAGLFAALLAYVAVTMARPRPAPAPSESPAVQPAASGSGRAPDADVLPASAVREPFGIRFSPAAYRVRRFGAGSILSVGAGVISALLGVGGGLVKVPVMHLVMGVPLRVATATSNLMIGVTASASAVIYLLRGEVNPFVAGPVCVGVFLGASAGSRLAHRVDLRVLRLLFVVVLVYTAFQMAQRALGSGG
jgi:uncharacterized membrane protein YfcA